MATNRATRGTAMDPSREYLVFSGTISHLKSAGADSCDGCSTPMRLIVDEVALADVDGTYTHVTSVDRSGMITWQTTQVPVHPTSWGRLKAMYH